MEPSVFSSFATNLLRTKNLSALAKTIYAAPSTLKKLMKKPETCWFTVFVRVCDQFDLTVSAYDKRPAYDAKIAAAL